MEEKENEWKAQEMMECEPPPLLLNLNG